MFQFDREPHEAMEILNVNNSKMCNFERCSILSAKRVF